MLEIYIRNPAFKNIISGAKKYELRLLKGIFSNLTNGDKVLLCNKKYKVLKTIKKIYPFSNFTELLSNLGLDNCLINCDNMKQGIEYINTIYNINLQKRYSCIALEFY